MIKSGVPLAPHTTLQVGGAAEHFTEVHSIAELKEALSFAKAEDLPSVKILGGGSNVLVSDTGVSGIVIKIGLMGTSELENGSDVFITVAAGEMLDAIVAKTVASGWWGLENLSHIPGSVGATPVQNVGAYGVEVCDVIDTVTVYDSVREEECVLSNEACQFAYRDSIFKQEAGSGLIVTAVTFKLSKSAQPKLHYKDLSQAFSGMTPTQQGIREAVIKIRSKKFPDWHVVGTAGSFFKNPIISKSQFEALKETYPELPGYVVSGQLVKVPLGWILEHVCNLKGERQGEVGTYEGQALVLVNHGSATATDIEAYAQMVVDAVNEKTGITPEWEVTRW